MNAQLNGLIVTKESPNYETCCLSWNRAIDKHPSMIIYCQQTEDVVFATINVQFLRKIFQGMKIHLPYAIFNSSKMVFNSTPF